MVPHEAGGWIVRDPLSTEHTLLQNHELIAARTLDGHIGMTQWHEDLQQRFPDREVELFELQAFLHRLVARNLVHSTSIAPRTTSKSVASRLNPLRALSSLFRIRIPLTDPTPLLKRIHPVFKWCYTVPAMYVSGLLLLAGLIAFALNVREFALKIPTLSQYLTQANIVAVLVCFVAVKCLHEFAHAMTCFHFGAECRRCGVMFLVFTPVLYTDVSDSWSLPRRQRIAVTAAGIFIELLIAAACMLLWCWTADGFVRTMLCNTCLLYTSPSPRDRQKSRMPSSA